MRLGRLLGSCGCCRKFSAAEAGVAEPRLSNIISLEDLGLVVVTVKSNECRVTVRSSVIG